MTKKKMGRPPQLEVDTQVRKLYVSYRWPIIRIALKVKKDRKDIKRRLVRMGIYEPKRYPQGARK